MQCSHVHGACNIVVVVLVASRLNFLCVAHIHTLYRPDSPALCQSHLPSLLLPSAFVAPQRLFAAALFLPPTVSLIAERPKERKQQQTAEHWRWGALAGPPDAATVSRLTDPGVGWCMGAVGYMFSGIGCLCWPTLLFQWSSIGFGSPKRALALVAHTSGTSDRCDWCWCMYHAEKV
jgi:hypothetical protein